jgi:hypothetical protein
MSGVNTLIIASDYNEIQSKIATVMGSGSGTTGYGQTLASNQVGQYDKITVNQWNNLRDDIIRCRQHQTGITIGSSAPEDPGYVSGTNLPQPTQAKQVKESWRVAYSAMADDCETNRLTAPPPASQATLANLVSQQVRTTAWNGTIKQTVTVTWATADEARYFFNTGGQIEFSSSRSGGSAGTKNVTWTTILSNMGTIKLNYTGVTCTGTGDFLGTNGFMPDAGPGTGIGTSDELIFEKDAPAGAYAPNKYYIYARVNSVTDRKVLTLTIHWGDDSGKPPSFPDPGFGIDEDVDGTLTSDVQVYRASGANVSRPIPSASSTGLA